MKRQSKVFLVLLAVQFSMLTLFAGSRPDTYIITVNLEDLQSGKVYLSSFFPEAGIMDSAVLVKGRATFKGTLREPHLCLLKLEQQQPAGNAVLFFLEKGLISITGNHENWGKALVSGSLLTKTWEEWQDEWERITEPTSAAYKKGYEAARQNNGVVPDSLQKAIDYQHSLIEPLRDTAMAAFLRKYPASSVSACIVHLRYISYPSGEELVRRYWAMLAPAARESFYGKKIGDYLAVCDKTAVGTTLVFAQSDTSGRPLRTEDFRGKYLLIDFWASWCGPCRKENPNVVTAYRKFHQQGFEVLGVSLDNNKEAWLKAIRQDKLEWAHVSDLKGWKNAVAVELGINMVPTNLLLDPQGKIIARDLRGEKLQQKLEELFN